MTKTSLLVLSFWFAACSTAPNAAHHVRDPGSTIYTPSVQKIVLEDRGGGLAPPLPPGATCDPQQAQYTLTIATHELAWQYCAILGGKGYGYHNARILDAAEWNGLQPTLSALVVSDAKDCGADKPELALIVTVDGNDLEYGDDFYGCNAKGKPLIKSNALDDAQQAFGTLRQK
jgi:hypothetical protein